MAEVMFRTVEETIVLGLRLADDRQVVAKLYPPGTPARYLETVGIRKLLDLYTHPIVSW